MFSIIFHWQIVLTKELMNEALMYSVKEQQ